MKDYRINGCHDQEEKKGITLGIKILLGAFLLAMVLLLISVLHFEHYQSRLIDANEAHLTLFDEDIQLQDIPAYITSSQNLVDLAERVYFNPISRVLLRDHSSFGRRIEAIRNRISNMESFYLHQTVAQYVSATILPIIEDFFDELTEEVFISEVTHEEQNSEVPNTEQFLTPYYNSANSFLAHNTEFGGRNDGPPGELTEDPFQSLSSEPRVNPAPPSVSTTQDDRPLHYYYELVSANLTNGEINFVTITLARSNGSRMITESERIQLEDILREAAYPVEVRVKILGAVIVDGEDILPRPLPGVLAGDSQGGTISPPND